MFWLERVMPFHNKGYSVRYYWCARWRRWTLFAAYATKYSSERNVQAAMRRRIKAGESGIQVRGGE